MHRLGMVREEVGDAPALLFEVSVFFYDFGFFFFALSMSFDFLPLCDLSLLLRSLRDAPPERKGAERKKGSPIPPPPKIKKENEKEKKRRGGRRTRKRYGKASSLCSSCFRGNSERGRLLRSAVRSARRRWQKASSLRCSLRSKEKKATLFQLSPPLYRSAQGRGEKRFKNPKNPETHLQVVDRIGLERVHHVRELHPVSHEEHGHVVAHEVPVALARVELDREAARVADRLGRAALVDDGREARDHGRLRPRRAEEVGAGEVRDVMRRLEEALGRGAAGVDDALRNALPVKLEGEGERERERGGAACEVRRGGGGSSGAPAPEESAESAREAALTSLFRHPSLPPLVPLLPPPQTHVGQLLNQMVILQQDGACVGRGEERGSA